MILKRGMSANYQLSFEEDASLVLTNLGRIANCNIQRENFNLKIQRLLGVGFLKEEGSKKCYATEVNKICFLIRKRLYLPKR